MGKSLVSCFFLTHGVELAKRSENNGNRKIVVPVYRNRTSVTEGVIMSISKDWQSDSRITTKYSHCLF